MKGKKGGASKKFLMTLKEKLLLRKKLGRYQWYHRIQLAEDVYTDSPYDDFRPMWDFNLRCMEHVDFMNKKVLDVGCRDGLFSFEAEKRGAREIVAIDNDLSLGTKELLIPFFHSKVQMHELNVYELTPERFGLFDVVLFLGILYHLRYPFWGLKKAVDCLSDGGLLLIESGMLIEHALQEHPLMYCPVEASPYEPSSCTFFNSIGLCTTLKSFDCALLHAETIPGAAQSSSRGLGSSIGKGAGAFPYRDAMKSLPVARQFFIFRKDISLARVRTVKDKTGHPVSLQDYWHATHGGHSRARGNQMRKNSAEEGSFNEPPACGTK